MPNADNIPKRCKLTFVATDSTSHAEILIAPGGAPTVAIPMPELSLGEVEIQHVATGQSIKADLREPKVLPGDVLNCTVVLLPHGRFDDSWKPDDKIRLVFHDGFKSEMGIRKIQPDTMTANFSWASVHRGAKIKTEIPGEPPQIRTLRGFTPIWDGNLVCRLNLEFASERKWGTAFLYLVLAIGLLSAAFWAYKFSNVGGADKTTTITPTPSTVCVPATPHNVRYFYLQKDPRRFMGKVSHLPEPFMSFACPTPPPYDPASKTSDVSACEICFPQAYAKPGATFKMDAGMLQSMFFQKDPQCFIDPVLPFKPSADTMRKALRVDLDCQDYSFNGSLGCWDYSKCNLIMPNYETTKPPTAK